MLALQSCGLAVAMPLVFPRLFFQSVPAEEDGKAWA